MAYTYEKQLWKDYPDTTTPITADRLNHMEDGIKGLSDAQVSIEVVDSLDGNSTTNAPSVRAVNDGLLDKYSTEEQRIGTWIDGKPIYRKTFTIGSVSSDSAVTLGKINNLDTPILMVGASYYNGLWTPLPRTHTSDNIYQNQVYIDSGDLKVGCGSSSIITKGYLVLEYTKTTD